MKVENAKTEHLVRLADGLGGSADVAARAELHKRLWAQFERDGFIKVDGLVKVDDRTPISPRL